MMALLNRPAGNVRQSIVYSLYDRCSRVVKLTLVPVFVSRLSSCNQAQQYSKCDGDVIFTAKSIVIVVGRAFKLYAGAFANVDMLYIAV